MRAQFETIICLWHNNSGTSMHQSSGNELLKTFVFSLGASSSITVQSACNQKVYFAIAQTNIYKNYKSSFLNDLVTLVVLLHTTSKLVVEILHMWCCICWFCEAPQKICIMLWWRTEKIYRAFSLMYFPSFLYARAVCTKLNAYLNFQLVAVQFIQTYLRQ